MTASVALAANAQAGTYTVTTNGDDPAAVDPTCMQVSGTTDHWTCTTLRDALAQTNPHVSSNGPDTIDLTQLSGQTIALQNASELPISGSDSLTITGPGAGNLTISAGGSPNLFTSRIFNVSSPAGTDVSISGVKLSDGNPEGNGGAILNESGFSGASLTLTDDAITSDRGSNGGGVYSFGPLTLSASTISGDTASNRGAGLYVVGLTSIDRSTISGNTATNYGGGIAARPKYGLTITNSTISGNTATNDQGGGLSLQLRSTTSDSPTEIDTSTFSGNKSPFGAGIAVGGDQATNSPITIRASTLSGNTGTGNSSEGGGLAIYGYLSNPFHMVDSTISGNSATNGGGVGIGFGTYQVIYPGGSIAFDNTTIDGNTAATHGGGIYLTAYAQPQVAAQTNGGLAPRAQISTNSATVGLSSTIVANDSPEDLFVPASSTGGGASDGGGFNAAFSLIQQPGSGTLISSNQVITGVDPQLGGLGNNGGPTQTMLPAGSSPAIDQGKAASGLTTDQRGDPRTVDLGKSKPPGGDGTDIGSVEVQPAVKIQAPPPAAPQISAIVDPATGITRSHATLNGKVNTSGLAVTWHFQWGKTTSYGKVTTNQGISAGGGQVPVSFQVNGLSPNTVYHYRVVAVSSSGQTATSSDAMFKTPAATINVDPGAQFQGKSVRVFGRAGGCPTGDRVTLISKAFSDAHEFAGEPAIFAKVLSGDRYSTVTTIPANRKPARYVVTARCGGGNLGVTAHLRVLKKQVHAVRVIRFTG